MSEILPSAVYLLCFLTSAAVAVLLTRGYRRSGARFLLWSAVCFVLLALNNLTLILDLLVFPELNFRLIRLSFGLGAVVVLLFGFIWDLEE